MKPQMPAKQQQKSMQQKPQQAKFTIDDIKQIMNLFVPGQSQAAQNSIPTQRSQDGAVAGYTPTYYLPGGPGINYIRQPLMNESMQGNPAGWIEPTDKYEWGNNIHNTEWYQTGMPISKKFAPFLINL